MENNELLSQVLAAMQEQTEVLTKMMDTKIKDVHQEIRNTETRINLKIENEVSRKIEALFDGYKLTHEKQWELERQTQQLQRQVDDLQARLSALENKIA